MSCHFAVVSSIGVCADGLQQSTPPSRAISSRLASSRYGIINPVCPWPCTASCSFHVTRRLEAFNGVVWFSHYMPEMSQLSGSDVTQQLALCFGQRVNLFSSHQLRP